MEGIVVKSTGSWYELETADKERLMARLKGKFRLKGLKSTNPIAVGDRVAFDREGDEGVITKIFPRKNYIIRRSINLSKQVQILAANVDQLFLLITLKSPQTFLGFVDRFLMGAEAYRIPTILLYNKTDRLNTAEEKNELKRWKSIYDKTPYEQMEISAKTGVGVEEVKAKMKGKTSIFGGHSGVGKTTLINKIAPGLDLPTAAVSERHHSGRHTTTFAEMFQLDFGARIIDTPGIKGFGNVNLEKEHLAHYFPEMRSRMDNCRFSNCVHINEPGCAIKEAVVDGKIAESRYFNYVSIYEDDDSETYRQKGY